MRGGPKRYTVSFKRRRIGAIIMPINPDLVQTIQTNREGMYRERIVLVPPRIHDDPLQYAVVKEEGHWDNTSDGTVWETVETEYFDNFPEL